MRSPALFDVVVPTLGRPSLGRLLEGLRRELTNDPDLVGGIVVVDDRPAPASPLAVPDLPGIDLLVLRGTASGPAAARNAGWHVGHAEWVVFLDDDVEVGPGWSELLLHDLASAGDRVVAVQARIEVPFDRHGGVPDDNERVVAQLADAAWITADMAVRRRALVDVGGFDERFLRAYREDTDLALRLLDGGGELTVGRRVTRHPVRPGRWTDCLSRQRGNADDALMRRLHGPDWRTRGDAPAGLLRDHLGTTAVAVGAVVSLSVRHRAAAAALGASWLGRWVRFLRRRRAPGRDGVVGTAALAVTSAAIPPLAVWWWLYGLARARRLAPGGTADRQRPDTPLLVLFDRDGTLIHDVPYNGDPGAVSPVAGAREALDRLRDHGIPVGMVTNQSGIARGLLDTAQVQAVNRRVEELLGPFTVIEVCPHGDEDGCTCRKPAPGMVLRAASAVGVAPARCAVVGDIATDVGAAQAAGARGVLVPTAATLPGEVLMAREVARDLQHAVELLVGSAAGRPVVPADAGVRAS